MSDIFDIKGLPGLLNDLQNCTEVNSGAMDEVHKAVELLEQKKKLEVKKLAAQASKQTQELKLLLDGLDGSDLFSTPADQETLKSLKNMLTERLSATRALEEKASSVLDDEPIVIPPADKAQMLSRTEKRAVEPRFRLDDILGNWIHRFSPDAFTCQSFWEDGAFKEYDFEDEKLVGEREGTFTIGPNQVNLSYDEGKKQRYDVTGYSPDCIDYLIENSPIRFDYMPEDLLNNYLGKNLNNA